MDEEREPSRAVEQEGSACPRCGAPLPTPGEDGFATCEYCGVRTKVSLPAAPEGVPAALEEADLPLESPVESTDEDLVSRRPYLLVRIVVAIVVISILIAVFAVSQPQSNSTVSSVAHCSVGINASATSGPAPFTANFTAEITSPAGVSTSTPEWQFGPFGPGFDFNFTYGTTVNHTWDTNGSYGVHVTVPDSTGQDAGPP